MNTYIGTTSRRRFNELDDFLKKRVLKEYRNASIDDGYWYFFTRDYQIHSREQIINDHA